MGPSFTDMVSECDSRWPQLNDDALRRADAEALPLPLRLLMTRAAAVADGEAEAAADAVADAVADVRGQRAPRSMSIVA